MPTTAMLHGWMVPGLKSFRDMVKDREEQLSMAILTESVSKAWA
jgi:hypothetical protein